MYLRIILLCVLLNSISTSLKAQELNQQIILSFHTTVQRFELANNQDDSIRFIISTEKYALNDSGKFEKRSVQDSNQNAIAQHIHVFPRNFVLGPGEVQTVMVQLIRTGLKPDEYNTTLYIEGVLQQSKTAYSTELPIMIESGKYQVAKNDY